MTGTAWIAALGLFVVAGALVGAGRWMGKVSGRLAEHDRILSTHAGLLQEIRNDIKLICQQLPSSTVTSGSPMRLTELGEQIAQTLGAREWAAQAAESLREEVGGLRPDQIQQWCFTYVYDSDRHHPDSELAETISVSAAENGIDRSQVLDVLDIVLRDELTQKGCD